MFTQCPECKTIFELDIDDLKAADGRVCCGECDKIFNALVSLTDIPPGEQLQLHSLEGITQSDDDQEPESLRRSGDLFPEQSADDDQEQDWAPDDEPVGEDEVKSLEQSRWEQKLAELGLNESRGDDADEAVEEDDEGHEDEISLAEPADHAEWLLSTERRRRTWPWAVAAALAGIALVAQSIHYWREDLAKSPALTPWLESFYSSLGAPLPEHWDIQKYSVEKDTVSDHPEVPGALLVNAMVANTAALAQPYPLLKITLLDRWGEPLGERFFAPAEYLAEPAGAGSLIAAGETVEASVLIVDPGAGAVSYGIDACLRDAGNKLTCAHDSAY